MNKLYILGILFASILSCQSQSPGFVEESKNAVTFHSQGINEEIIVNVTLSDTMTFSVIAKTKGKRYFLEGIALKLENETTDLIEDEDGFSYFADVYEYRKDDCWVYFKVDNESYDKLVITMSDECKEQLPELFSIVQTRILHRK